MLLALHVLCRVERMLFSFVQLGQGDGTFSRTACCLQRHGWAWTRLFPNLANMLLTPSGALHVLFRRLETVGCRWPSSSDMAPAQHTREEEKGTERLCEESERGALNSRHVGDREVCVQGSGGVPCREHTGDLLWEKKSLSKENFLFFVRRPRPTLYCLYTVTHFQEHHFQANTTPARHGAFKPDTRRLCHLCCLSPASSSQPVSASISSCPTVQTCPELSSDLCSLCTLAVGDLPADPGHDRPCLGARAPCVCSVTGRSVACRAM